MKAAGYVNNRYTETAYGLPFGVGTLHQNRLLFLRLSEQQLYRQLDALLNIGLVGTNMPLGSAFFLGQAVSMDNSSFGIARAHASRWYSGL